MHDVVVDEPADDLRDRIRLTDVREELVTESLPSLAPRTIPAMSTNDTVAGSRRSLPKIPASTARRGSGRLTTPMFGSIVANG
ncbi:hypothetical protein GCM10025863_15250 [Microbacterium suwonense]|uniref:Uncharacterized protein n=1 Tax=Microbacterium suwonense TaxID=683047 RepID=A0ABN6X579_9MICO|nr:hypothetical protein GCM10025863_15250 [Microbacterium suwonense]